MSNINRNTSVTKEGWILDVGGNGRNLEIWIKLKNGETIPAFYKYRPSFYALPRKGGIPIVYARKIIESHEEVYKIQKCKKHVSVTDEQKTDVLQVWAESPKTFKKIIQDLEQTDLFDLFNIDIPIAQMFFYELDLFPMGYCSFEFKMKNKPIRYNVRNTWPQIENIILRDSNEKVFYEFPKLKILNLMLGKFGNSERSKMKKSYYRRPRLNERLISCKIRLIEGYNFKKEMEKRPPWMVENNKNYKNNPANPADTISPTDLKDLTLIIEGETESDTILKLSKEIENLNPDIILTDNGDEYFFPFLVTRASAIGCSRDLYLSRDKSLLKNNQFHLGGDNHFFSYGVMRHRSSDQFYLQGRIHIDTRTYGSLHFSDGNIHGVVEVSRVSRVPIQRLTRITIGGALQSIQFKVADDKGYLVPPEKKNSEDFQTTMTLLKADRGGHIFEPIIGVFERVGEFDFTSMYPMIMVNYNVSPDTMNCTCCSEEEYHKVPELPFHTCSKRVGIIPEALKLPLKKRVAYKKLGKKLSKDKARIFKKMNEALKWILVVSFGYLGFKNARFGRVEGHQAVCAYSRELLLKAQELAEKDDFRVLHGIVDSMWLQHQDYRASIVPDNENNGIPKLTGITHFTKKPAEGEELKEILDKFKQRAKKLTEEMKNEIKIPIALDALYKFIVFLPSRENKEVPVLNHYWGVTYDGNIKVRGVEIRRRDAPKIVKDCQTDIINILSKASGICDFMELLSSAKRKLDEYCEKVDSGNVSSEELVIKNRVSRKAGEYKVKSYQAVASERMLAKGIEIEPGQKVEYIIKNASSKNPNKRIILQSEFEQYNCVYDKEKYKELLRRSFRNIIPFEYDVIADDLDNWSQLSESANKEKHTKKYGIDKFLHKNTKKEL